jgi:hypothetical protein
MRWIMTYTDFLIEGKKGLTNAGSIMKTDNISDIKVSVNFSDETLEPLRRSLYDEFMKGMSDDKIDTVNKCVSTIVYCLDKRMRIDSDIIERLAKASERKVKAVSKKVSDMVNGHFGGFNQYGMKM